MNLTDLIAYSQQLGVPVSLLILACAFWLFVIRPMATWIRADIIPRWLTAQEQTAKAMQDISRIVQSLEYEVRESRRVSIENNERLVALDLKVDRYSAERGASRARNS